jgi:L-serine dehydratase
MFLSVFELFKIGIGPSSSHTVGPMVAAARFLALLSRRGADDVARISVSLHGSLAFTGKGHGTDRAVVLGLIGENPDQVDPDAVEALLEEIARSGRISPPGLPNMAFDLATDLVFDYGEPLSGHSNGMKVFAHAEDGSVLVEETYYSIGGGFVKTAAELDKVGDDESPLTHEASVPYPFASAAEMLTMGRDAGMTVAEMKRANELTRCQTFDLDTRLDQVWAAMAGCMARGLREHGLLPGGLKVKRRAAAIHEQLKAEAGHNRPFEHTVMDWLSVYAMAVNEENAAGGRVVTAPTNGAAGVVPAVIRYYLDHCPDADAAGVRSFLLAAAAIGGIIKHNASISGAEVGCQGEVGSASAMAAAGLAAALGGTNEQVENAAEIALEHHLGMTCDPVGGLVQVPCIERNALGAVKAVTAASLSLRGDGSHFVPLDSCIETMRQTGLDMSEKYKETSKGGLAVSVVEC